MKNNIFLVLVLCLVALFAACQTTSTPQGTGGGNTGTGGGGTEPGPPVSVTDDVLFIHHSCGENWLNNSLRAALAAKDYVDEVNESNYGTCFGPDSGRPDSLWGSPGDNTDMNHWILWFNDYLEGMKQLGTNDGENRIILFKSCYPNNAVVSVGSQPGDPFSYSKTVANYKAVFTFPEGVSNYNHEGHSYKPLDQIFAENPDTLFIFVTAPPLCHHEGSSADGQRARDFYEWVQGQWLSNYNAENPGLDNVTVFDWFDFLAYAETAATHANLLKFIYGGDTGDSHPNGTANAESTVHFVSGTNNLLDTIWQAFSN